MIMTLMMLMIEKGGRIPSGYDDWSVPLSQYTQTFLNWRPQMVLFIIYRSVSSPSHFVSNAPLEKRLLL